MNTRSSPTATHIGAGPSGLPRGSLLHRAGIKTISLQRRSRDRVLSRIHASLPLDSGQPRTTP